MPKEPYSGYPSGCLMDKLHHANAPISAIVGLGSMLSDGSMGELTPEQRQVLEEVVRNGELLADLLADIVSSIGKPD